MNAAERTALIAEKKEAADHTYRVWCKDDWHDFPVWKVPVSALLLNVDNRRFAAERKIVEDMLGRTLDPESNPTDEECVTAILLDTGLVSEDGHVHGKPTKDTLALTNDWLRRKQETPFWIRPDGAVRNGNRRLAVIKRLIADGGSEGLSTVEAVILDPNWLDEDDLFKMEQREQLTENFKVRYTDINLLIALRDAAELEDIDWSDDDDIERVAGLIQHIAGDDRGYASVQLRAVKYMDAYLADLNKPGQYQLLRRQVERFRDVGILMRQAESDYPDDAADVLRLAFAAVSAGSTHLDIRSIRKMFLEDRAAYEALLEKIDNIESEHEDASPELEPPDISEDVEDEEADPGDDTPPPKVRNYPGAEVKTAIDNSVDAFRAAERLDVLNSLVQAWGRLNIIPFERLAEALTTKDALAIAETVRSIADWATEAQKALPHNENK